MGMKHCSVFAVPVWLSEVLGMHGELAHILEGSFCSIWQLGVETQLVACSSGGECPVYVDLEGAQAFSFLSGER